MARFQYIRQQAVHIALAIVTGLTIAGAGMLAFAATLHYVGPAHLDADTAPHLRPFVDGRWVKVPFDIVRDKECLAQSTVTLRRWHDYGGDLGRRQDIVVLGLYNTTLTPVGREAVMLWFHLPGDIEGGAWDAESKTQDDCGGWLNFAARRPRTTTAGTIQLPVKAP